jgi:putative salt-induced outer membrane protein
MKHILRAAIVAAFGLAFAGMATAADKSGWSGEGAISLGFTTGNTETKDAGVGVKLSRTDGAWKNSAQLVADYSEQEDVETKNRLFGAYQLDRQINDRLFAYGRGTYEKDEFSGFDNRIFAGVGLGYEVIQGDTTSWTVQGGPGWRRDELRAIPAGPGRPAVRATTEDSFAVGAGSRFKHKFNDAVAFTNDTDLTWADAGTQVFNTAALTARLSDRLSGRVSFDVRYDTDAPFGREDTDTATRVSLVYGF